MQKQRTNMRTWLKLCCASLSLLAFNYLFASRISVSSSPRPNIVFFLADDLGFNDVPWNNPEVQAPNLETMAVDGSIITNFYTYQVCNPSRAALMTGYLQQNSHSPSLNTLMPLGLPTHLKLLPSYFKDIGYSTHLVGKWHLGFCKEDYLPTRRGFDTFYGYFSGGEDYYTHTTTDTGIYDFFDNESPDFKANGTYSTILFRDESIRLIKEHNRRKDKRPLFLMVAFQNIHGPLQNPPGKDVFKNRPESMRKVALRIIYAMDKTIGKIVEALDEENMDENTILVFTSDNGGDTCLGGNNYPFRGGKHTLWEGGIRVPALINLPQQKQKSHYHGLFHMVDWLPTLFEAAGGLARSLPSDGVSHLGALTKDAPDPRDEVYILHRRNGILRKGKYKMMVRAKTAGYQIHPDVQSNLSVEDRCPFNEQRSSATANSDTIKVYNIEDDPGESNPIEDEEVFREMLHRYYDFEGSRSGIGTPYNHTDDPYLLSRAVVETGWC